MNVKWSKAAKAGVIAATTCALLLQPATLLQPSNVVSASAAAVANQVVRLNANSTISLQNAQFLMQDNGRILAYTVLITNNGNSELSLNDYWIRVKTSSGKSFSTRISDQDKNVSSIAPKSSKSITYYSYVDQTTKLTDLNFDIIMWDFSVASYERRLGTIKYPQGSTEQTNVNRTATMLYSNMKLTSSISNYTLTQDDNLAYLQINYKVENQGLNVADLSNLNLFIQTQGAAVYPVNMGEHAGASLQPKQQKLFTFHIALPKSVAGQPLSLVSAIKEGTSGVMLPIASFAIPATKDSTSTDAGKVKATYVEGEMINTFVDHAFVENGDTSSEISIQYALRNTGRQAVSYPNFSFSLVTGNGIIYPLTFKKSDDSLTKLLPQIREEVEITGTIPSSVDLSKAKLLVRAGVAENSEGYVVGTYQFQTSQQAGSIGSEYKHGDYTVRLNAIQRTATSSNDVLVADIQVINNGTTSKSVPNLTGYFTINGVRLNSDTQKIALDNNITIGPGGSYNFIVHTNIPYASQINNIAFVLTEKAGANDAERTIYRYSGQQVNAIPSLAANASYEITNLGRKSEAKVVRTAMYEGASDNFFYAEFEVSNKEARAALLSDYNGYLKNEAGQFIPVTFTKLEERIDTNGRVLIFAWAKVRKNVDIKQYEFIFGQTAAKAEAGEGQTNSILVKPVKYSLAGTEASESQKSLSNIAIAGHELSIRRVNALLNVEGMYNVTGLKLLFNYDLTRDENYDYIAGDHKILIEFVDQDADKATYSKLYSLGASDKEGDELKVAENISHEIIFQDSLIQSKVQSYSNYVLNIYDVFQDAKILIASKELKWFTVE